MSITKRKTLTDYFTTSPSKRPKKATTEPIPSAEHAHSSIPGLSLLPNFLTPPEESQLLTFLSTQTWRTDLARRVIHYGGTYCLLPPRPASPEIESTVITAPPIPPELEWVLDRMVSHGLYASDARPGYCIVNDYAAGQGISAHVENFRFGEPVVGLSLAGGDYMRFHELVGEDDGSVRSGKAGKAERTGRKVDVWLERGGLVVMRSEARRRWQHEIVRGRKGGKSLGWRRVSLTFRVEKGKER